MNMILKKFLIRSSLYISLLMVMFFCYADTMCSQETFEFTGMKYGDWTSQDFGWSMDLSGDGTTIVVGGPGNTANNEEIGVVRVYRYVNSFGGNSWYWSLLGDVLWGNYEYEQFGHDVSINYDGTKIFASSPTFDRAKNYNLSTNEETWQTSTTNTFVISSSAPQQRAGHAVSSNNEGNILVMGAPLTGKIWYKDLNNPFPYTFNDNNMILPGEYAGASLDLDDDGNTIVVGAYKEDNLRGEVYVMDNIGGDWVQRGSVLEGVSSYDEFGFAVSISDDGNTVAAGNRGWDPDSPDQSDEYGQAQIYTWEGTSWVQKGSSINGSAAFDECGYSVALSGDGNRIAVGYRNNSDDLMFGGAVQVFDWDGAEWIANGNTLYGFSEYAQAGSSVALSDDGAVLGIGATGGDNQFDEWSSGQGYAKMYEGSCTGPFSTQTVNSCSDYTWIDGVTYTESNSSALAAFDHISGCDSIVHLDLTIPNFENGIQSVSSCSDYTWIDGNTYTENNNSAFIILEHPSGCDSLVYLDLTITDIDNTVSLSNGVMTSQNSAGAYQWIDCDNGNNPIDGEDSASFTPSESGNYAVVLTNSGCSETSDCVNIVITGVQEENAKLSPLIFPNPSSGLINVEFHGSSDNSIQVFNVLGELVFNEFGISEGQQEFTLRTSAGLYIIEVIDNGRHSRQNLVIR